jgi:signal transduction histidine kinase
MGVISTDLSLLHLSDILEEERPYPHSYFLLIDEEGRYVGHPDSTRLFSKTIFGQADLQKNKDLIALGYEMTSGNQGQMLALINNTPSLVCFKPVPGTTWSLAIVCPDSDVLRGYNRFSYIVLSLLVVGLILIVLYCHRITSRVIQPIRDLLEKTQEIAKGNMDVVIARSKYTDDIGCLQNSYVTMLESLRHYMDSVRVASEKERLYNEELEQATKLVVEADRQKTLFMQNMTHQVRTPLNIIMGFAQILSNPATGEGMAEEEVKSIASTMDHNSKLLNRLVLMLYDSSDYGVSESNQCQKHELVPANEAMREMVDYVMRVCPEARVGFETELPDDIVVATNKKYLQYSLAEVLMNAVRYSDREHIMARVSRSDAGVRFIIEDTGKGIAEADRERIFKFFTKADDFSEGLGLGLPLTKRHAQTLGGEFFLDPDYHDGCRFVFELPI